MKDNEAFAARIAEFVRSIERGGNSRENISSMMSELEQFAPHSQLSGIIFYGERERTPKEIADEALLRERVWKKGESQL